ncbi:MAG: efflux RND transporter periplasmic adaptor subunit [Candidatus Stahlbacteria bacterium]|nr:efflux RND transporter periplasmic adaptor subunit [Candidatus Stahlbacteria bacterium]
MKKLIWSIIIIIVAVIIIRIIYKPKKLTEKIREEIPTEVVVEEVRMGKITKTISYTGNIVGREQINVLPIEETGKLMQYLVKEGDKVLRGDTIALIDRSMKGLDFKPAIITSPISGVIGMVYLDEGATVSPAIPVVMVANIDIVKVEVNVPENDIKHIKRGMKANITVASYSDELFVGELRKLSPVLNQMSRSAKATITISNFNHKLKPGMYANVDLVIEEHKNAIVVPEKTVIEKEGKKVVFVLNGEYAEMKEVETGLEDSGFVEILAGLNLGEKIITLGNYGLTDKAKVTIKN